MTVQQLIAALKGLDPNQQVLLEVEDPDCPGYNRNQLSEVLTGEVPAKTCHACKRVDPAVPCVVLRGEYAR